MNIISSSAGASSGRAPCAVSGARKLRLSGWGRYPVEEAEVYRPEQLSELAALVANHAAHRSLIARGAGRAYGDAALNRDGRVACLERFDRMLSLDPQTGILRCEAGVTIADLINIFLPRGFFPPIVPGTKFVTMGGALAADIHGKNHHRDSSFSRHVSSFSLMTASGEIRRCSRTQESDVFRATAGAMGLTGIILDLEFRLQPVESAYIRFESFSARDLDQAIEIFENNDARFQHSVAWIDCMAGRRLGRAVVKFGNFAARNELHSRLRQAPFFVRPKRRIKLYFNLPSFALSSPAIRTFNSVYFASNNRGRRCGLVDYDTFFFPLDSIDNWNRIYGIRGFLQYQCVWPEAESRRGLVEVLEAIEHSGRGASLAVLKKFGAQDGLLSFPMPGYTLALDFRLDNGLFDFLNRLDRMVIERGGRVYLAKDSRMDATALRAMYPDLARWQEIKLSVDPKWRFCSSLSRRLEMDRN